MKTSSFFKVGNKSIGWVSSSFFDIVPAEFEKRTLGTYQILPRTMTDYEIEKELKVGICELGDVAAFLENPPKGSKDGNYNLFYLGSCVVYVYWYADRRGWLVYAWRRGGRWDAGGQVFSPATVAKKPSKNTLGNSETLSLENRVSYLEEQMESWKEVFKKLI